MTVLHRRLGSRRLVLALVALVLIALAWWGILAEGRGLTSRALTGAGGVPLTFIAYTLSLHDALPIRKSVV